MEDWLPLVDALIKVQPNKQTTWQYVVSGGVSIGAVVIEVSTPLAENNLYCNELFSTYCLSHALCDSLTWQIGWSLTALDDLPRPRPSVEMLAAEASH